MKKAELKSAKKVNKAAVSPDVEMIDLPLTVVNKVLGAYERMKAEEKARNEQAAAGKHTPNEDKLEELLCSVRDKLAFLTGTFSAMGDPLNYKHSGQGLVIILEQIAEEVESALGEIFPDSYGEKKEATHETK